MIVALTYKCKREEDQISIPEGLKDLPLLGYSAFEHNLNILKKLNVQKLFILTDGCEDAFESHPAYQRMQETTLCQIVHVEPDFSWHDKVFFDLMGTVSTDVLWLCGDMFLYGEAVFRLVHSDCSAYIEIYTSSNIKQHDPNLRFRDYLKSYSTVYQNGGSNADTIPAAFFRAADFKKLRALSSTLPDEQSIMYLPLSKKNLQTLSFLFSVRSQPSCLALLLSSVEDPKTLENTILYTSLLQQARVRGNTLQLQLERQLIHTDRQSILYIRNAQLNTAQLVFESLLNDAPTVALSSRDEIADIPQMLSWNFGDAYPQYLVYCGDEDAFAYADAVYRYLLTRLPAYALPQLIRVPSLSALTTPMDFSWLSDASAGLLETYLRNTWNIRNLATGFAFTSAQRYELYAFILGSCLNVLFSTNEEPFFREFAKVILHRFFRMSGNPEQVVMMAMEANVIASLCGKTVINALADKLSRESGMSYGESLLYALASMDLFAARNVKKDFAKIPRKALVDNLDDQMITAGVASADELFAVTLALLRLNGHRPEGAHLSAAASVLAELTDAQRENSLYVPDEKTLRGICRLAEQTVADHEPFFETLWEASLTDLPLEPTPNRIRGMKAAMQRNIFVNKYRAIEADLFHELRAFCTDNNITYRLLRCGAELDPNTIKQPCFAILNPWDLERFAQHIRANRSDLGMAYGCNTDPNIYADAYLYKAGTVRENHWNLSAAGAVREIGIPILTTVPRGSRWTSPFRFKLANAFNRIYCQRSGYYVPTLTKAQSLIKTVCRFFSAETVKKFRDRLLKRPAAQSGQAAAYLDLHHVATVTLNDKAVRMLPVYGDEHPVIDAPDHVFTQGKKLLNTFYRPIETSYRICYGGKETYVLRVPEITVRKKPNIFKRFFAAVSRIIRSIKAKIKRLINRIRKAIKDLQTALKPAKVKLARWWKLFAGFFRGMGLCVSPKARAMKAYRNKHAGERCFLVGNGPSLRAEDLDALSRMGEITFACNFIHKIYGSTDWRPTYHCLSDSGTVRTACWDIVRNVDEKTTMVVRDFAYDKMTIKPAKAIVPYSISQDDYKVSNNFLAYHYISHATVMTMMLECAMYMGFKEIYLIGVDATTSSDKGGNFAANYFTPEQRAKLDIIKRRAIKNYDVHARRREIALRQKNAYEMIAVAAQKRGIKIYNATRGGALEAYERVDLDTLIGNS